MHPALQMQEILRVIFGHCRLPTLGCYDTTSDLPAVARTCRTFKEPALDLLWHSLPNPCPIAQCLPEASCNDPLSLQAKKRFSFTRSLTQDEWAVLRNYTRRIRYLMDLNHQLNWESFRTFLDPPTASPLFPNLRYICVDGSHDVPHLLDMPFPSLTSFDLTVSSNPLYIFQDSLEAIFQFSPNIRNLSIRCHFTSDHSAFGKFFSGCISKCKDLKSVICDRLPLDASAVVHLSRMPALVELEFTLTPSLRYQIASSNLPLRFPNLRRLSLTSPSLQSVSTLLVQTQLPAMTDLVTILHGHPLKQHLASFFTAVKASVNDLIIEALEVTQISPSRSSASETPPTVLTFEDLQPCIAFRNFRHLDINLECKANLTSTELLDLASTWPRLENLLINAQWGWGTQSGITPDGLLQLLQKCPSLNEISLALDTGGYTECSLAPEDLGVTLPPTFSLDVLDSRLEADCVPAIADFLACIASHTHLYFNSSSLNADRLHTERWNEASELAYDIAGQK